MSADILKRDPAVLNLGVGTFAEAIGAAGAAVVDVDWRPPAGGSREAGMDLAALVNHPRIEAANREAFARFLAAEPVASGIGSAIDMLPGMGSRTILHAGPPVAWEDMCGPMRGAALGAILFEGWAEDLDRARSLADSGGIDFDSCHHHQAVGPMSGVTSPSMPMWIVENAAAGNTAFSSLNEGLGKVLRFGANGPEVIERLRWMRDELADVLARTLDGLGPIELKPLIAQALHMGDEAHNRNAAATSLLIKRLVPPALRSGADPDSIARAFAFMAGNDHFFINLSMAACKAMLDAARGVPGSSMVTAMARNGVEFGVQMSATGDRWFTAPAPVVDGLYFSGFGKDDAARDIGDSAITETAGLGGFAMAAAPAIVRFVGGSASEAIAASREMRRITIGENPAFTLPILDFSAAPAGIDVRKVADGGVLPIVNTGIAHREAGIGQIGAGITAAPMDCFVQAVRALHRAPAPKGEGPA